MSHCCCDLLEAPLGVGRLNITSELDTVVVLAWS